MRRATAIAAAIRSQSTSVIPPVDPPPLGVGDVKERLTERSASNPRASVSVSVTVYVPGSSVEQCSTELSTLPQPTGSPEYEYENGAVPPVDVAVTVMLPPRRVESGRAVRETRAGSGSTTSWAVAFCGRPKVGTTSTATTYAPAVMGVHVRVAEEAVVQPGGRPL